jgi:hypothetical protein
LDGGQQLILNEFINSVDDWCDCSNVKNKELVCPGWNGLGDKCPDWQRQATAGGEPDLTKGKGVHINRETWAWNAAAGVFAYAFGTLASHNYLLVGQDQLVAGTWPDNEPEVAMLDWTTGDPNAKYYVTQLLASTVGAAVEKALFSHTVTFAVAGVNIGDGDMEGGGEGEGGASSIIYALPFQFTTAPVAGKKGVLLVNKAAAAVTVTLNGLVAGSVGKVVEVAVGYVGGPGFQPPQERLLSPAGTIRLAPFAVAVVVE